ncbi:MAG: Tim44 domain-containing protein, partial [Burkholderiales bacterium]
MKHLLIALSTLFFTSVFVVDDAEARRLGGGRSAGAQRQALPEKPATPPAAQQAAPAQSAGAAAAKKPMSPWMGALAGLAAGLGLAWLLGDHLGSVMMAILLGLAAVVVVS